MKEEYLKYKFLKSNVLDSNLSSNIFLNPLKLFLFNKKPAIGFSFSYEDVKKDEKNNLEFFILILLQFLLNKKLYLSTSENLDGEGFSIYISKKNPKKIVINNDKDIGIFLGFPKCCIERYCIENNEKQSYNSAKRYLNQCEELGIKDIFEIGIFDNRGICEKIGFIPCSPKCKKALKIYNELKKVDEKLKNESST